MKPENIERLITSTQNAINSCREAIALLHQEKAKNMALLALCGKVHSYLNIKNNKTWEEEEICRSIYSQLTGLPKKESNR